MYLYVPFHCNDILSVGGALSCFRLLRGEGNGQNVWLSIRPSSLATCLAGSMARAGRRSPIAPALLTASTRFTKTPRPEPSSLWRDFASSCAQCM